MINPWKDRNKVLKNHILIKMDAMGAIWVQCKKSFCKKEGWMTEVTTEFRVLGPINQGGSSNKIL